MLFPIPIGYFVSVYLLISGVLNCMEYLADKPVGCTHAFLLNGLAEAGWPIIVASVILLLIQLNQQMEKLRLVATVTPARHATKPLKKKKHTAGEDDEAPQAEPAPQPPPAVSLASLARPAQHMPTYPNSPIPGGGRVPQQAANPAPAGDLPPRPEPVPATHNVKRAPSKTEAESLNFFKVD
ncbi:MAG: hypothetical protein IJO38_00425 [Akkermansia sp.]|nr:hypothetical protein [Akkermansia sp.]